MSNNVKRVASSSVVVETSFDGKVGGHWSMVVGGVDPNGDTGGPSPW